MEDMGTVAMDADALLFFAVNVAADVRPPFEDQALAPGLFHFMGKDDAKETAADDNIIIHSKTPPDKNVQPCCTAF